MDSGHGYELGCLIALIIFGIIWVRSFGPGYWIGLPWYHGGGPGVSVDDAWNE